MKDKGFEQVGSSPESSPEKFKVGAESLVNEKHPERNEDVILADKENGIFAVFDGMGGHAAGEVAAGDAKEYIAGRLKEIPENASLREVEEAIKSALNGAHKEIFEKAEADPEQYGEMGTTASVVKIWESGDERKAVIGNIGDSRVYKLSAGNRLEQVTLDDGFWRGIFEPGEDEKAREFQKKFSNLTDPDTLNESELAFWHYRSILSQALGQGEIVPRISTININKGERLLTVSDGVPDNLTDKRIEEILSEAENPEEAAQSLVNEARDASREEGNPRAKQDDMSAIVIEF